MITGGCLCGAVRYEVAGKPKFSVLCCCRDCQKVSGAGYVPVMGTQQGSAKISGETKSHAILGASGRMVVRHFCPVCGSLLFGAPEDRQGDINLYIGTLDDPSLFKPTCAIFARSRPELVRAVDGIPSYAALPSTTSENA